MNENKKLQKLIKFLKEKNTGLSSEEITSTYFEFSSYKNIDVDNFLTNKFGKEWIFLEHDLKSTITKYISENI
jgi:hypothetical protein|tara:strand:+ start:2812 stop:3030 length:219 start_codon:yes stop_codon:yes gene_type:complete